LPEWTEIRCVPATHIGRYAIDLCDGGERALTREGAGTVACGTAEFVAQAELGRLTGHWWAPGDTRIADECFDEAPVAYNGSAVCAAIGEADHR
jgi:dipeptidyl-peptidase-4